MPSLDDGFSRPIRRRQMSVMETEQVGSGVGWHVVPTSEFFVSQSCADEDLTTACEWYMLITGALANASYAV